MKYIFTLLVLITTQLISTAQYPGAKTAGAGASANMNMGHFYGKIVDLNNKGIEGITIQLKGSKFDPTTKKTTETIKTKRNKQIPICLQKYYTTLQQLYIHNFTKLNKALQHFTQLFFF